MPVRPVRDDVTWNDQKNVNHRNQYLMSTELWDNHNASDIVNAGMTCGEWERIAEEQKQAEDETMALIREWSAEVEQSMWDEEAWSFTEPSISITRLK